MNIKRHRPIHLNIKKIITSTNFRSLNALTLLLCLITIHPAHSLSSRGDDEDDERSGSRSGQNKSKYIRRCEDWFSEIRGVTHGSLPWYELKQQSNSYIEAIFGQPINAQAPAVTAKLAATLSGDDNAEKMKTFLKEIAYCEAYFSATDEDNYSDKNKSHFSNPVNSENSEDQVQAQMMQCLQQQDQQSQQSCMQQAQSSSSMSCTHEGWETHDYLACKKISTFLKGFTVGKAAMQLQQTWRVGNKQNQAQEDLIKKQNSAEGLGMADTLEVQKGSLEQQGNMAYEMAAFNGAQAGILMSMISSFPKQETMINTCIDAFNQNISALASLYTALQPAIRGEYTGEGKEFFETIKDKYPAADIAKVFSEAQDDLFRSLYSSPGAYEAPQICEKAVTNNNHFFLNQAILDQVKEVAIAAGIEALANGLQGKLLKDQADIVDDAINDIEEFEKPVFEQAGFEPSLTSECLVDPEAEGCITSGVNTSTGFGSQNFNSGATGSANLGLSNLSSSSEDGTSSAANTDRNIIPSSFGTVQVGTPTDNSFSDGKVRPGTIKPGKGGGAGAGGGGGSASAGGGGGGGQKGDQQQAAAPQGSSKTAIKVGSMGTGLGRVSGGRGSIGNKPAKSDNPFNKLLGKTKAQNSALNFRDPAQLGKGKKSLFERLSSRYGAVISEDRLNKYEPTDP